METNYAKMRTNSTVSNLEPEPNNRENSNKVVIFNIVTGQLLAILNVGIGIVATIVQTNYKFDVPLIIAACYYFLLFTIYMAIFRRLARPKLYYFLIAIVDSQANFMNIYAFSVTHFNYPFVINLASLFWTLILTVIFIKTYKYTILHWIGVVVIVLGIVGSVTRSIITDANNNDFSYLGLFLCLGTSICYAV